MRGDKAVLMLVDRLADVLILRSGGQAGRSGSQIVPLHKFNRLMDIGTEDNAVGVCLWGPPGCGKSSAMTHIKEILQVEDLICVNSDDWVEFLQKDTFPNRMQKIARKSIGCIMLGLVLM